MQSLQNDDANNDAVNAEDLTSLSVANLVPTNDANNEPGPIGVHGGSAAILDAAAGHSTAEDQVYPYGTRLKHDIRKPKIRTDGTVTYSATRISDIEPSSRVAAMEHPLWRRAMNEEFEALVKNKTWHLVPPRAGLNVIDSK